MMDWQPPVYEDRLWYPILVKMGGGHKIVEMQGCEVNRWNNMVRQQWYPDNKGQPKVMAHMNKQVQKLAAEAKFMAEETINQQISKNTGLDAFAEHFAALIVQECVDVIQKEVGMKYKDGGDEAEEFMAGHYSSSLLARVKIKQHFGVKE